MWQNNPECPVLTAWTLEKIEAELAGPSCVTRTTGWSTPPASSCPTSTASTKSRSKILKRRSCRSCRATPTSSYFHSFFLGDVATLKTGEQKSGYEVRYWDSGSGTGTNFFWNYDHPEDKKRALFRNLKFKQAMSYALDRTQIQKVVYFGTGWPTTGTMTVKSFEFNFNDDAKKFYEKMRDAYVAYDPAKAKSLLDGLGLKDVNGDGFREYPDGSKLEVRIEVTRHAEQGARPQSSKSPARTGRTLG